MSTEAENGMEAQSGGDTEGNQKELSLDDVQTRLEELLSKRSLSEDTFIQQHMNAQMYISLAILVSHCNLHSLAAPEGTLLTTAKAAVARSAKMALDESGTMVRPLFKSRRNTLILHDLEGVSESELQALFAGSPESEAFTSLKPDVNNTAFATFTTDEAAQNIALWLRSQKINGQTIRCSVKSEHFVRSFFPASPAPAAQSSPYMMSSQAPGWGGYTSPWMGAWQPGGEQPFEQSMSHMWSDASAWGMDADGIPFQQQPSKGEGKVKGSPKGKGKGRKQRGGSFNLPDSQMHNMESFDPSNQQAGQESGENAEDGSECLYKHDYRKYTRQYIIEVCNAMEEIKKPDSYERMEKNDPALALFRQNPCKDWAPLPTPLTTFASSFFGGENQQEGEAGEGEKGKGKGRKGSKGTRNSRAESADNQDDSEWAQGDTSWWTQEGSNRRSYGRQSWNYEGGYGEKKWVQKEPKSEQDAEWESGKSKKMSWVEKVKSSEVTTESKDAEDEATDKAAAGAESSSWADKVRQGATRSK